MAKNNGRRYENTELIGDNVNKFRCFLKKSNIYYEPSACYNMVHFEFLVNDEESAMVRAFLEELP